MAAAAQEAEVPRRPPRKSAPGQPWAHMETVHLIDAYEERWTKLRRGQLKAQQWEDVAADVAARCAAAGATLRKTGTQCRHKLEKLRKRYRIERARPVTSLWPYFRRMDHLERGPLPVSSAFPPPAVSPPAAASDEDEEEDEEDNDDDDDDDEEEEEEEEPIPRNNTRSINGLLRESGGFGGFAPRPPQPPPQHPPSAAMLSTAPPRKRVAYEAFQAKTVADKVKEEEEPPVGRPGKGVNELFSAVLRDLGEGMKRLERRRMEIQWEIERGWKETEARHNKMLQDAQRQLQEALASACASASASPTKKSRREHGGNADGSSKPSS